MRSKRSAMCSIKCALTYSKKVFHRSTGLLAVESPCVSLRPNQHIVLPDLESSQHLTIQGNTLWRGGLWERSRGCLGFEKQSADATRNHGEKPAGRAVSEPESG